MRCPCSSGAGEDDDDGDDAVDGHSRFGGSLAAIQVSWAVVDIKRLPRGREGKQDHGKGDA